MKTCPRLSSLILAGSIVLGSTAFRGLAQENSTSSTVESKPEPASTRAGAKPEPANAAAAAKPRAHTLPKGIEEIVRMSEAGISNEVLKRYIENSGLAYEPTGADLIAMKQRGVPDEVTVVMLARSSAIRAEYEAARRRIAAPAIVRTLATDGQLDPESYEFFWFHHAYPRALAGSYQTLAPYSQSYLRGRSYRDSDAGPKWRTDGFARESFRAGKPAGDRRR